MAEFRYQTRGVCSTAIRFTIDRGLVTKVEFEEGCDGSLQALCRLVEGMPVEEVIRRLQGIRCDGRPTSCPDQLAKALERYQAKQ